MEICPKQQDTGLNLLIKTLKFSHTGACRCQQAGPGSSASSPATAAWLRDSPALCQGQGLKSSPPLCSLRTRSSLKPWSLKINSAKLRDF